MHINHVRVVLVAVMMVAAAAPVADAAKLLVANDGLDTPAEGQCGDKHHPCRSIGKAIANAAPGDTIIVGPGRYGDLDGDGTLEPEQGEEPADTVSACKCMIHIDKPLSLYSRDGAATTLLDPHGAAEVFNVIRVSANGVVIGKAKAGFTVANASQGITIDRGTSGARVVANVATGIKSVAFLVSGGNHLLRGNTAVGCPGGGFATAIPASNIVFDGNTASANKVSGFFITEADGVTLTHNVADANGLRGFDLDDGNQYVLTGNVARANGENGFYSDTYGGDVLVGNVATANAQDGFGVNFTGVGDVFRGNLAEANGRDGFALATGVGHVIAGNSIIGNRGFGVIVAPGASAAINGNNIFGNADTAGPFVTNCGVRNNTGAAIDASNNFWGAETGPGANPADNAGTLFCDGGSKVTVVNPAATKEFKVKPKIKL